MTSPVLAFALALAVSAGAPRAAAAPASTAGIVDPMATVGPPPAPGSDEAKADLAVVLWLQRTRSSADVARAGSEVKIRLEVFADALGPGFDAAAYPRTRALLDRLHREASQYVDEAKERYARPRPFVADSRVQPVVKREPSPSYPSSHGARGVLAARVLAQLAPARSDALMEVGRRLGFDRVVAGVHYPSDVLAGQRLGECLAESLLASPALRAEIEAIRATEWARSR